MVQHENDSVRENLVALTQAIELLEALSDQLYRNNDDLWYQSGVGRHMRHVMDFYGAFLEGLPSGAVDFDRRGRDPSLETSRTAAVVRLHAIRERIAAIEEPDRDLTCKNDGDRRDPGRAFSRSSVGRELQFLASHAVHHFAIMTMLLDRQGFRAPADFGVAPSTLVHRQRTGTGPAGPVRE